MPSPPPSLPSSFSTRTLIRHASFSNTLYFSLIQNRAILLLHLPPSLLPHGDTVITERVFFASGFESIVVSQARHVGCTRSSYHHRESLSPLSAVANPPEFSVWKAYYCPRHHSRQMLLPVLHQCRHFELDEVSSHLPEPARNPPAPLTPSPVQLAPPLCCRTDAIRVEPSSLSRIVVARAGPLAIKRYVLVPHFKYFATEVIRWVIRDYYFVTYGEHMWGRRAATKEMDRADLPLLVRTLATRKRGFNRGCPCVAVSGLTGRVQARREQGT
ncbi:hypothetical protein AAHA92_09474 [Salvia divinorum]|uniref:Uncharacterized protein n=1 Tax=Salvia divinorum TaxID=28513 RepID=A0ABD1HVK0_SALDI